VLLVVLVEMETMEIMVVKEDLVAKVSMAALA